MKSIIVDGNNLGWMAFGIVPLTHKGQRVEAIFVGLGMIASYLRIFEPDEFYVIWDGGRDAERLALYPDYKKRTKELTDGEKKERQSFFDQLKKFQDTLKSFGITQYKVKDREADDIIFNLLDDSAECIIVSTDKDFYQALGKENVAVYNPVKKQIIKAKDAEKMFGIPIEYFLDYRALVGDPSDNLPGIKGIGPKRAEWLINNVLVKDVNYENITNSQRSMINSFFDGINTYMLMKDLIRFKEIKNEEMEKGCFENKPKAIDDLQERAIVLLQQYGFEKHLNNFPNFIQPFEMLWRKEDDECSIL